MSLFLSACGPTYKRADMKENVKKIALKEYGLNVEVSEEGETLGLRFKTPNLIGELTSGDDDIYKKMNGLFMVLVRVVLSTDHPPTFIVLDMVDADNPKFRIVFTRYVEDLRRAMADALSHAQNQDRLLEEFVIGDRHIPFDPQDMDLVRLMLMAMDSTSDSSAVKKDTLKEVDFKTFLERVAENVTRRALKEKDDIGDSTVLRQISAHFEKSNGQFRLLLDMVSRPTLPLTPRFIEKNVLPLVAQQVSELFKSYRFKDFDGITVIEKNTGKIFTQSS
jgi:hypothetical protein